jgi:hypothetical protein
MLILDTRLSLDSPGSSLMAINNATQRNATQAAWLVLLAGLCAPACTPSRGSPPPRLDESGRVSLSPATPLSLGILSPGQPARGVLTLKNETADVVIVDHVTTSCPCISAAPLPLRLEPGATAKIVVSFDPTNEPDFRGGLGVEVKGFDQAGAALLRTTVDLEVANAATGRPVKAETGGVE